MEFDGLTVIDPETELLLQVYEEAPLAIKEMEFPEHTLGEDEVIERVGGD